MKSKSPYHGIWIVAIFFIIPIFFSFLFTYFIHKYQFRFGYEVSIYTGTFFAFIIGDAFYLFVLICGAFKGCFKNMILRVTHFISNARSSFKVAWMLYKEEVSETGLIFWIVFPIGCLLFGTTLFTLFKVLTLLNYI